MMAVISQSDSCIEAGRLSYAGSRLLRLVCFLPAALLILVLTFSSMYRLSSAYDETEHYQFGKSLITGDLKGASMQRMPITALNAISILVLEKAGVVLPEKSRLFLSRIPTVAASLLLAFFVFSWAQKLYGITASLVSLIFYAFCPNFLAHSQFVTNDVYCACLIFISVYFFTQYIRHSSLKKLTVTSVLTGIALLTKQTALLLLPAYGLILLYAHFLSRKGSESCETRPQARRWLLHMALFVLILGAVINAGYLFNGTFRSVGSYLDQYRLQRSLQIENKPFAALETLANRLSALPVPLPKAYVEASYFGIYYNATGRGHGLLYLLGRLSQKGWWYYFPVVLLLKSPLGLFIVLAIAALLFIKARSSLSPDEAAMLITVAAIFVYFTFFCTAQLGVRYLLPIFPFLYVLAARAFALASGYTHKIFKIAAIAAISWFVISSLSYYPHHLSYFNELIGDRKNMYKFLADSNVDWGQNQFYLAEYIKRHKDKNIRVNPLDPSPGTVIVNINRLVGVNVDPGMYKWLRENFEPAGHIAYSWLIYNVPHLR